MISRSSIPQQISKAGFKVKRSSKKKKKKKAKRKYDVYPSAYANMYGSAVCSGKVKPGGKKKK